MLPPSATRLREFLKPSAAPCISVYLPTSRRFPEVRQDPTRYRHMMESLEQTIRDRHLTRESAGLLDRFRAVADDRDVWSHPLDGLAVLGSKDRLEVYQLPRTVPEKIVVSEGFHLKPLWRYAQSADRFHVLALKRDEAKIYEGNRYALEPIPNGLPTHFEAVAGETTAQEKAAYDRGEREPDRSYRPGSRKVDLSREQDAFFRAIRHEVLHRYSLPTRFPLVLAAVPENAAEFAKIAQNPHLLPDVIARDPGSMTVDELREAAWKVIEPVYLNRLAKLTDDYRTALARGMASKDLYEVAKAAAGGRVGTLLVEADRTIAGSVNSEDGSVRLEADSGAGADDLLDDLAEIVLRADGEVVLVPADRMPSDTGLAAMYRF